MAAPIFRIARKLRLSRALARDSLRTPTIETRLLNVRGATGARHASNQALAVMPADMNDVKVWFGSQTGTAQGFGMQLQSHLQDASVNAELADLFDLGGDPSQISAEKSVIFIVSCFGRGEPTDSAKKFYHWIMDPARETDTKLTGLRYAVFGLGRLVKLRALRDLTRRRIRIRSIGCGWPTSPDRSPSSPAHLSVFSRHRYYAAPRPTRNTTT